MSYEKYFSKDYYVARSKFLENTKKLKRSKVKIIDDLTIDFALHETKKKETLLVLVSGTHGVEGYTGSAVQLFFLEKYFKKIKDKCSVLLVHALNPYGFKNNRRYNENNVDLNRNNNLDFREVNNFFERNHLLKEENLFDMKKALVNEKLSKLNYYSRIVKLIEKHGVSKTITVLGRGQNKYPKGVCFAGFKKEKSILSLEKKLDKITSGYKKVIFLDIHTGAAKKYNLDVFTANNLNSKEIKPFIKKLKLKNTEKTKKKGTDHIGGMENCFFNNSKGKTNIHFTLEYGTVSKYSTVLSLNYLSYLLIKENQVTQYGPFEKLKKIRKEMRKAYSPDTKKYKKFVIDKTDLFLKKLIIDQ